jgi:hypothetical protein
MAVQQHTFDQLGAEAVTPLVFAAAAPIGPAPQTVKLRTQVAQPPQTQDSEVALRAMSCHKAARPLRMDGDLSDWPPQQPTILNFANAVQLDPKLWTPADKQITADIRTAWDDNNLYVAVTVHKPTFDPPTGSPAALYQGDSLQVAFDPLKKAAPDSRAYNDSDFEYCLAQFQGRDCVYRDQASSAVYDSVEKALGLLSNGEVKLAVRTSLGQTVYEMAFSRLAVSPLRLTAGASMRWDAIVNLNDGAGRLGWLELTPGIGGSDKNPGAFMDIFLVP